MHGLKIMENLKKVCFGRNTFKQIELRYLKEKKSDHGQKLSMFDEIITLTVKQDICEPHHQWYTRSDVNLQNKLNRNSIGSWHSIGTKI